MTPAASSPKPCHGKFWESIDWDGYKCSQGHFLSRVDAEAIPAPEYRNGSAKVEPIAPPLTRLSVSLADVIPEVVRWLWPGRLPLGKLVVTDGDPGLGKSTMLLDLAARVTKGLRMPDGAASECGPAGVVLLTAEDGLGDTVRPRLEAAGANLALVRALNAVMELETKRQGDEEVTRQVPRPPTIADLADIEAEAELVKARLIIIDPLMAYLPGRVDSHRDQDIRRVLAPLAALAEKTGATIIVVRHLNKMSGSSAIYRGGGSIGIIGAARLGLLVAKDPDDQSRRILAVSKSNLAIESPALMFRLEDNGAGVARVAWLGESTHSAAALLTQPASEDERSALDEASDFLLQELGQSERLAVEIERAARQASIQPTTLRRARVKLGVLWRREGFGPGSRVFWALPAAEGQSQSDLDVAPIDDQPTPIDVIESNSQSVTTYDIYGPPMSTYAEGQSQLADPDPIRCADCGRASNVTPCLACGSREP